MLFWVALLWPADVLPFSIFLTWKSQRSNYSCLQKKEAGLWTGPKSIHSCLHPSPSCLRWSGWKWSWVIYFGSKDKEDGDGVTWGIASPPSFSSWVIQCGRRLLDAACPKRKFVNPADLLWVEGLRKLERTSSLSHGCQEQTLLVRCLPPRAFVHLWWEGPLWSMDLGDQCPH